MIQIEVTLQLDLGTHAPGDEVGLARAIAGEVKSIAEEAASGAPETSLSNEVHGVRPVVRYRVVAGASEWLDAVDDWQIDGGA